MSYHQERIEKALEREIGKILLTDVKDDRLRYVIITKATVTKDLSIATIYYTVLGNDVQKASTSDNLEEAKGFIRSTLGKRIAIRKIPELKFKYDDSLEYGSKIDSILKDLDIKPEE